MDADLIVLDLNSNPVAARRVSQARDIHDVLFAQMIMADERAVKATYVAGEKLFERSDAN
jgi:guanine deaminase